MTAERPNSDSPARLAPPPESALPSAENVVAFTKAVTGTPCSGCGRTLCGHDAVMSLVLGYRASPLCHRCLSDVLQEDVEPLVTRLCQYLKRRDCYRAGWDQADRDEGFPEAEPSGLPPCMREAVESARRSETAGVDASATASTSHPATRQAAARFDAGDMACGDLVLELRLRMRALEPGEILHLTALDPGAPIDIPSWCELTRHPLRDQQHPEYWIERRPD